MRTTVSLALPRMLLLSVAFLGSCGAPRGSKPHKGQAQFVAWDTNHDGKLSDLEFSKTSLARKSDNPKATFAKMDADGDGYISQAEFKAYRKAKQALP